MMCKVNIKMEIYGGTTTKKKTLAVKRKTRTYKTTGMLMKINEVCVCNG